MMLMILISINCFFLEDVSFKKVIGSVLLILSSSVVLYSFYVKYHFTMLIPFISLGSNICLYILLMIIAQILVLLIRKNMINTDDLVAVYIMTFQGLWVLSSYLI